MNKAHVTLAFVLLFNAAQSQIEQSRLNEALTKGIHYLHNIPSSSTQPYNQKLLLAYIYSLYGKPQDIADVNLQPVNLMAEDTPIYRFYQRLLTPSFRPDTQQLFSYFHQTNGMEHVMLWGIYPDILPLDERCVTALDELTTGKIQIRNVAHAALALFWSEKYRDSTTENSVLKYYNLYPPLLHRAILQEGVVTDSGMEGILGLICLHKSGEISYEWLNEIVKSQNPNGGWSFNPYALAKSDSHATLLALWVLLDFKSKIY